MYIWRKKFKKPITTPFDSPDTDKRSTQNQPDTGSGRHPSLVRCIISLNSEN